MRSDCTDVLNIGSDEMISINGLVAMISDVAKMNVRLKHIPARSAYAGETRIIGLLSKSSRGVQAAIVRGIEKTYP